MHDQEKCITSFAVAAHLLEQVHTARGQWQQQLRLGLYGLHLMFIPYQDQLELIHHSLLYQSHLNHSMSSACKVRLN